MSTEYQVPSTVFKELDDLTRIANTRTKSPRLSEYISERLKQDIRPSGRITREAVRAASGMTLRDYFAAKAMQGMWASDSEGWHCSGSPDALASRAADAYAMADAMLKARGEEK